MSLLPPFADGLPQASPEVPKELERIRRAYAGSIGAHGPRHSGVGWSSRSGQMLRLRTLLRLLTDAPEAATRTPVSVHDLGCGYGALWPLLAELETPPVSDYWGWDITPGMVRTARALYGGEARARFMIGPRPDEEADYGMVSGTFNFRGENAAEDWRDYVTGALTEFAGLCRKGMAFNLLDTRSPNRAEQMFYNRPDEWIPFAEDLIRQRGGRFALATDYLPDDFTLFLWFDRPA